MKKLKLDLGELEVQSFATAESPAGREGTVYGMKVSTDQVPHCPQEPGVYNVGIDASFGCLNGLAFDSGEIACGDNGAAADPALNYPADLA